MVKQKNHASKGWIYLSAGLVLILIVGIVLFFQERVIQEVRVSSEDCGEGTVMNSNKMLCWQKSSFSPISKWEEAEKYCQDLVLGGKEDWRLPTNQEFTQIIVMDNKGLKINETIFTETFEKNYWSSTEYNNNPAMHWFTHFSAGYQGYGYNYNSGYAVKCVRDVKIV